MTGIMVFKDYDIVKRSLIFWMWNDVLEADKICQQLRDFKGQGIEGVFIHPMPCEFRPSDFPGGMPGYLSDHYFEMVKVAVEYASKTDMAVWLYDEGGWPSGILNGYFKQHRPDLMHRQIHADGSVSVHSDYPDLLDPEVTRIFIEKTHEKYRQYVGEYFGSTIPGIFTDEPFFGEMTASSAPFSPVLEEFFRKDKGYEARDAALRMLNEKDEKATLDYFEVWQKLIRTSFLLPIRDWCHLNGLLFSGHFNGDNAVGDMVKLLSGNLPALHDCLDIPGCDAIWRQIHPLAPETDFPRMTSSFAGNKPVISESFAVYGMDLSPAEMKQIAAMQFVAGVNIIAPMAVYYSSSAGRQITTLANLYGNDLRWENYRAFADFSRRMSKVFDRTSPIIKASVPFPVDAMRLHKVKGAEIGQQALALAARQVTYDYSVSAGEIPDSIIPDLQLLTPCPQLRTRHLRSPRGERLLLVNSGLEELYCRFAAPSGYNAWYDPATGRHFAAVADQDGFLELKLPFAGVMVLLTIPGKMRKKTAGVTTFRRLPLEFCFRKVIRQIQATSSGFMDKSGKKDAGEFFSGTLYYEAKVELLHDFNGELVLPEARRTMCSLVVNGSKLPLNWAPYRWQVKLPAGKHSIGLEVSTTPSAAFQEPSFRKYLQENNFINSYLRHCDNFEPLFPDEMPYDGAYLEY